MHGPSTTRRGLLVACGSLALSGCLGAYGDSTPDAFDAADWPMVGGDPANTGYAPDVTVPDDPRVAWSATESRAHYAPVVFDGAVYVGGFNSLSVYDAASGETLRRVDRGTYGAGAIALTDAYVDATLVAPGGYGLLGMNAGGGVHLPDGSTRMSQRWRLTSPDAHDVSSLFFRPRTGRTAAAVVADGKTYAADSGSPGRLAQVDAESGTVDWTIDREDNGFRPPAVADGVAYAVSWPDEMVAVGRDGEIHWTAPFESHIPNRPTVAHGTVFVPGSERLVAFDTDDGSERWSREVESAAAYDETAPAVDGDTVYVATSANATPRLEAVDATTGEVRWAAPHGCQNASPVVAGETVLVPSHDTLYALDTADGSERWSLEPDSYGSVGTPALSDGRIYGTTHSTVYALEAAR